MAKSAKSDDKVSWSSGGGGPGEIMIRQAAPPAEAR